MFTRVPSRPDTRNGRGGIGDYFLTRLERLIDLRSAPGLPFDAERLLRHATYVTYVDCRDLGLEQSATKVVARLQR